MPKHCAFAILVIFSFLPPMSQASAPPARTEVYFEKQARIFHSATVWYAENDNDVLTISRPFSNFVARFERALRSYYVNHNFSNPFRRENPSFSNVHINEAMRAFELLEGYYFKEPVLSPLLMCPQVRKFRLRYFVLSNPNIYQPALEYIKAYYGLGAFAEFNTLFESGVKNMGREMTLFLTAALVAEGSLGNGDVEDSILASFITDPFFAEQVQALNIVNDKNMSGFPRAAEAVAAHFFASGGEPGHRARGYLQPMNLFEAMFTSIGLSRNKVFWASLAAKLPQLREHGRLLKCYAKMKGHDIEIDL